MNKSICKRRNVINCYANEIEMKGFNAINEKRKQKRGRPNKVLYKMRIRPNLV